MKIFLSRGYRGRLPTNFKLQLDHKYDSPQNSLSFFLINNDPGYVKFLSLCITRVTMYYDENDNIIIKQQNLNEPICINNKVYPPRREKVTFKKFIRTFKKNKRRNKKLGLNYNDQYILNDYKAENVIVQQITTQISSEMYGKLTDRYSNEKRINKIDDEKFDDDEDNSLSSIHTRLSQEERNVAEEQGRNSFLSKYRK